MSDNVNAPSHYCTGKFECIDVMEEVFGKEVVEHFCLCNAFKYLYRTNRKNGVEDIQKAQWYLNKYLELEGISATNMKPKYNAPIPGGCCNECVYASYEEGTLPCRDCMHSHVDLFKERLV